MFRVASVHFSPLRLTRPSYQGLYEVDAVVPGENAKFVVSLTNKDGVIRREEGISNRIQFDQSGFSDSPNPRRRRVVRDTIYGNEIALDLVNEWVKLPFGATTESHPGLWFVRDRILDNNADGTPKIDAEGRQEWRDATEREKRFMWDEDIAHARAADAKYARDVFDYWDGEITKFPRMIKALPKMVRDAANAYGWTTDWLRGASTIETKKCQFCDRNIRAGAIVCPHQDCQQVVDYERFAIEMKRKQDALTRAGVRELPGDDKKPGKAA